MNTTIEYLRKLVLVSAEPGHLEKAITAIELLESIKDDDEVMEILSESTRDEITDLFEVAPELPDEDVDNGEHGTMNHYECPECKHEWTSEWGCACDDDCPNCGERHISPHKSEEA